MKIVNERPTEGQFLMIWEYVGVPWSQVLSWENGVLYIYDEGEDKFSLYDHSDYHRINSIQYVVL